MSSAGIAVPRLHWEDFSPGQVTDCGSRLISRAEIVAFAAEYDPQPMHLDEQAASAAVIASPTALVIRRTNCERTSPAA